MKRVFGEYGKVLVASIIGMIALALMFSDGAFLDAIEHLQPENPDVTNGIVKEQLANLQARSKPQILLKNLEVELGDTFQINDLIQSVKDADGRNLINRLECYLDGISVSRTHSVTAKELTTYRIRFYVEDSQNLFTEEKCVIVVANKSGLEEADTLLNEWNFGYTSTDQVKARYYSATQEDGRTRYILSIEGRGRAKEILSRLDRPWHSVADQITDVRIGSTIRTSDVSYWFYGCKNLKQMPELKGVLKMNYTFYGCTKLQTGYIPYQVQEAESAFYNCTSMTACVVDSNLLTIMDNTFYNCTSMRGSLVLGCKPISYINCFGYVASNTGGVYLKVYAANDGCGATVSQMVEEERQYPLRGAKIIYKGVVG